MGTKIRVTIDLEEELNEERIKADDLVELLCGDMYWTKASLTIQSKEKLIELVGHFSLGENQGFGHEDA